MTKERTPGPYRVELRRGAYELIGQEHGRDALIAAFELEQDAKFALDAYEAAEFYAAQSLSLRIERLTNDNERLRAERKSLANAAVHNAGAGSYPFF